MSVRTEFVTNAVGKRVAVLLDLKSYARLKEAAEDLADIRVYDKARPRAIAEVKRGHSVTLAQHLESKAAHTR